MIDPANPDYQDTPASAARPPTRFRPLDPGAPPLVSIVTAFRNTPADVFEQTASSVFSQTLQQCEWIIVNDASDDAGALECLERYRRHDPRVRVIDSPEHTGPGGARNLGASEARAEYLLFFDSDDLLEPTAAEKMLWYLRSHPEHHFVNVWSVRFGADASLNQNGFDNPDEAIQSDRLPGFVMIRRETFRQVGGFDGTIRDGGENWDLWLRLAAQGTWGGTIREYLAWQRTGARSPRWANRDGGEAQVRFEEQMRARHRRVLTDGVTIHPPPSMPFGPVPLEVACENRLQPEGRRILMIIPWMTLGGADKFNLDLVSELSTKGWQVTIVATLPGDNSWLPHFGRCTSDIFILWDVLKPAGYPGFLAYLVQSRQFDVVLMTGSQLGYTLLPYLRSVCPEPAYVDFCHMEEPVHGGFARFSVGLQEQIDLTIVSSRHLRDWMVERGADPGRIEVVHTCIDAVVWAPSPRLREELRRELQTGPDTAVVLFAGRLCEQKQPDVLARVVRELDGRGLDFVALVAGDGPDRSLLEELIDRYSLRDRLRLLGSQSPAQVRRLMVASDIFFLPSQWEGIALTLYEAMASGLVVLAADVGGQAELVTPESGVLIRRGPGMDEVSEYVKQLERLIRDREWRSALGQAARSRILAEFTIDRLTSGMLRGFEKASHLRRTMPRTPVPRRLSAEMASEAMELWKTTRVADELWQRAAQHDQGAAPRIAELESAKDYLARVARERQQTILDLEAAKLYLAREAENVRGELERSRAAADAMRQERDEHEALVSAARKEAAEHREKITELERNLAARTQDIQELAQQVEALTTRAQELEIRAIEHQATADRLWRDLNDIWNSTGWAFLQKLYAIRFALFPQNSARERAGQFCMGKLRSARHHASQGPRAFARACARAMARPFQREQPEIPTEAAPQTAPALLEAPQAARVDRRPLVSVILPVYNQAELLKDAIESVLAQTYENWELIVLNDGSKDDIASVFAQYAGHPKIRLLTQVNQKLPKALSNAFEFASGELWTWTSADNLMGPEQLSRQVDFLLRNPDVDMVYADYLAIDDRGAPLADPTWRAHNRTSPDSPAIHLPRDPSPLNAVEDNFIGPCFMYRSYAGKVIGEYAPEFGLEDYDYWMRMNRLFRIAHLDSDEVLYQYRVHDNSISAQAVELKIGQRVARLMEYERERKVFYGMPWLLFVDAVAREKLAGVNLGEVALLDVSEAGRVVHQSRKKLVLLSAGGLAVLEQMKLDTNTCVAAWFGGDPELPYSSRAHLPHVDICFCQDARTGARVGLFHRLPLVAPDAHQLFELATAFGNNHLFYRSTTSVESRTRCVPEPFVPPDRRPRVLLQVDDFQQGGLEQVVLDVLAVLRDHQFDPALLVLGSAGIASAKARHLGFEVLQLPTEDREGHYRRLLAERNVVLVNAHFSQFGARVAADAGVRFVQTVHSCYVSLPQTVIEQYRRLDPLTSAYICTSGNVASYADLKLGLSPEKMVVIPNGLDASRLELADRAGVRARVREELGLAADDFVFLHVGSIYRDKAQKMLVTALAEVRRENPRVKLVLLGRTMEEPYLHEVREEIRRLRLEDAVKLPGFRDDVAPYYAGADAFMLPSFWEGWSLSLAEAVYMGLPVIATAVGSAPDLLPQVGGHLIRPACESVLDLDINTLDRYLRGDHSRLVTDLAEAMREVSRNGSPPSPTQSLRQSLDRHHAYTHYARLFSWILQNGDVGASRRWTIH